jgi:hypothetical protein
MTTAMASVRRTADFALTGDGSAGEWAKAEWLPLSPVSGSATYSSRAKTLYSDTGMYFLFHCEDRRLTCSQATDFDDIYEEDVVEVFLWPDPRQVLYFEYELSPLGVELPLLIPNQGGIFMGWRPWHYEGARRVRRATVVRGGPKEPMAAVEGWTAECFVPFALMRGLGGVPPTRGALWHGNLYRIDYDESPATHWAWSPASGPNFHNYRGFGTLRFD